MILRHATRRAATSSSLLKHVRTPPSSLAFLPPLRSLSTAVPDEQQQQHDISSDGASTSSDMGKGKDIDRESERVRISFYIDTVFPIKLGVWDVRYLLAQAEKESLLESIKRKLVVADTQQSPSSGGGDGKASPRLPSREELKGKAGKEGSEDEARDVARLVQGFRVDSVEAREKDGGAFVTCSYLPPSVHPSAGSTTTLAGANVEAESTGELDERKLRKEVEKRVVETYNSKGERPWYSWRTSQAHVVEGKPWQEDILNRFPSPTLRIEYESGPELSQEQLYALCRPYGRIRELEPQPASNKDLPRFANVTFVSTRMAAAARNSMYGLKYDPGNGALTTLRILYKERPKGGKAFREWMAAHPRIVIPILAVLAGGLSYAIFDPIRAFFVRSKVSALFSLDKYRLTKWLKRETLGRLNQMDLRLPGLAGGAGRKREDVVGGNGTGTGIERERLEAAEKLELWLKDMPDTFITVTGPPGSGKSALVSTVTSSAKNVLVIDCAEIVRSGKGSDGKLVSALASQLGYFPQFQWASSFNNLIDIASVGLIGTKAGFSTNLDVQIKQVLDVSLGALKGLSDDAKLARERAGKAESDLRETLESQPAWAERVREGWIHDGRLDCVAGNGVMGELGMGIEADDPEVDVTVENTQPVTEAVATEVQSGEMEKGFDRKGEYVAKGASSASGTSYHGYSQLYGPWSTSKAWQVASNSSSSSPSSPSSTRGISTTTQAATTTENSRGLPSQGTQSTADIDQMPVIIIKNFEAKDGSGGARDILWTQMADWAATLVENRVAHCIFINDTVAVSRSLARALPSKPFSSIVLTDATSENAVQYVQKKLREYGKEDLATTASSGAIERLGGRLTDLETLIQKMRAGSDIEEAVDDIIARSATEIVKNCFGDDEDSAKSLAWSREQAWFLVKNLSKEKELSYADLISAGPFKGQEKALRALEQAEIVSVLHREGHAATVRPGKPSYRAAFKTLVDNKVFSAQNELALNSKAIAGAQGTIKSSQEELVQLSQLFSSGKWIFGGSPTIPVEIAARVDDCLRRMHGAQADLERLGNDAKDLKKKLAAL